MISATVRTTAKVFHAGVIPNMLVNSQFLKCICFLFVDKQNATSTKIDRVPAATAFLVSVPIGDDIEQVYAVTARHVIDKSRAYGDLFLRLRLRNGNVDDIQVPQNNWICHRSTDVAVMPIEVPNNSDAKFVPFEMLVTDQNIDSGGVGLGDDVLFVGLFTEYSGSKHDRPIVRFGNISLMHEEIPLSLAPDCGPVLTDAYLVEARSWGGHSGSPAFVYYAVDREPGMLTLEGYQGKQFALLGLTHGHWEIEQDVAFIGDILGRGKVPVNAGMAVVIPAQKIIDTLMREELVEERTKDLEKHQKRVKTPRPDISIDEPSLTRQQFHDLLDKASQPIKNREPDQESS